MSRRAPIIAAAIVIASSIIAAGVALERHEPNSVPLGLFVLQAAHSDLCLAYVPDAGLRVAHLEQAPCVEDAPVDVHSAVGRPQIFVVVQHGFVGYPATIRVSAANRCATVARGVVFGPPAIDVLQCGDGAAGICEFNADDQGFHFHNVGLADGDDVVEVHTPDEQCWDVRGGDTAAGAEVIRWRCTGADNQRFRLRRVGPEQSQGPLPQELHHCEAHLETPEACPMPPCV